MNKQQTTSGAKAHQRTDTEHRAQPYLDWHRTLGPGLLMLDVDCIEWRIRDGELMPVAVMEITRVDPGITVHQGYLDAIIERFESRDMQARVARWIAAVLGVKAFIVLFRSDCTEFWIYNLTDRHGWWQLDPARMEVFLERLS